MTDTLRLTPGIYIDGLPIQDVDFTAIELIGQIDVVGRDTTLNIAPETIVRVGEITSLASLTLSTTELPDTDMVYDIPDITDRILEITRITGDGSVIFWGDGSQRMQAL